MPTPKEIEKMRRNAALAQQGDFYVHEVVECVSSDDENCGKEDLPAAPDPATPAAPSAPGRGGGRDETATTTSCASGGSGGRQQRRASAASGGRAGGERGAPESVATTPARPSPPCDAGRAASGGDYNQPD